ncbi:MAG: hypothetical protein JWM68_5312 [Verrucomicrobiales bacterium]|nr:hypothetical protein [Verrucomicrobiales bacterium]
MNLDEAQKQTVRKWISDGLKLSEVQSRLASELGLTLTYMEARFLMDDLKLQPLDPVVPPPAALKNEPAAAEPPVSPESPVESDEVLPEGAGAAGAVSVSVDQLTRPGAMISGKVTFSDGKSADWYLDQTGRLGVAPQEKGYKPSQPDLIAFQTELQSSLAKMGF